MNKCENCRIGKKHGTSKWCLDCRILERNWGELPSRKEVLLRKLQIPLQVSVAIALGIMVVMMVFR